ncbi:MAG TPA: metallophosphoesterase [Methanoregula sp.]|nr:metallophosphoesterase [Methanoregula sp.]
MKKSGLLWYGVLATGVLVICCIILLGYMNWEAGTVEVTALSVPGAPDTIVFIADPHVRPENLEHTREVIRVINSLHPAVVLIGGDFSFHKNENLSLQGVWSDVDAPVYAVLGNHDYLAGIDGGGMKGRISWLQELFLRSNDHDAGFLYSDFPDPDHAEAVASVLEQNGVTVLRNEFRDIDLDGKHLLLVGVDDIWAERADPPDIPDTRDYVIYLVHEPAWRKDWDADLVLSGHTHGGQYNIPPLWAIDYFHIIQIRGLSWKGDVPLYITRGTGTSDHAWEFRYLSPPEIVVINPEPGTLPGNAVPVVVSR